MMNKILVLGSSNIDFILRIPRFHQPGETILAEEVVTAFGGKGANQAIASKRLGGQVIFITKLGSDPYGKSYRRYLIENRLDRRWILADKRVPTGIALIELAPEGENRIIVSPGANGSLSGSDLKKLESCFREVKVFVAQMEIPISTVKLGLEAAKAQGALTLLNPSPPIKLLPDILCLVDYIVPNESEAQFLTGMRMKGRGDLRKMAAKLLEIGAKNVVITLGPEGLFFKNRNEEMSMKAYKVNVVDTTAAGDAFMGGLAYGLSRALPIQEVLKYANGAGALATTRLGAQPSLPSKKELHRFLGC